MERYQIEIQAATQASNVVQQSHNKAVAAAKTRQVVENTVAKLTADGYNGLAVRIQSLNDRYRIMGATSDQAGKMQYQAARLAAKGQRELAVELINAQEKHLLAANAARRQGTATVGLYNKVIGFTGAATGAAGAIAMVAGETDGWLGVWQMLPFKVGY